MPLEPYNSTRIRAVRLKPGKGRESLGRHPWILEASLVESVSPPRLGEQVDVLGADGRWIGRGLYHPESRIRVRMYVWSQDQWIDAERFAVRIGQAIELRRQYLAGSGQVDGLRWINSEGDFLSGLVVDGFAGHLVVQVNARVLMPYLDGILGQLVEHIKPLSISLSIDEKTARSEGLEVQERLVYGQLPEGTLSLRENGLTWRVDLVGGQKTGYYLDQRENRLAASRWVPAGARVLDVCTYAGGFALTLAKLGDGASVVGVDSSARALDLGRQNAAANGILGGVEWEQADFFEALSARVDRQELFDMVVLDPPKLAGARDKVPRALAAYHRLNYLAIRCLHPGGVLVSCSCSGRVSRSDFVDVLLGAARRAGRDLQILENRGPSADHPVNIHCPETDYLKCLIGRVL
ncbi:MAG: class I SAM-dependent rRNA methyltransferase [Planctomycetota bacterium]|nr:MAG: class I SAM-dependent rRNA methyltransferase [Planctomycetota bacterium]